MKGKTKYIRKVLKVGRDNRARVVRDRREGVDITRITEAFIRHTCNSKSCPDPKIVVGHQYLRVSYLGTGDPSRNRPPVQKTYHMDCLPENLLPCRRFFGGEL